MRSMMNMASSSKPIRPSRPVRPERSRTPSQHLSNKASSIVYDIDDSEVEEVIPALFASNGSLCSLSAFPLPPTTAPLRLKQARSLSNMSTKYHQESQVHSQHTQEQPIHRSPLRERRCKKPLTIKAPLPPSRMPLRRAKSSSSMVNTPPPCPPPSTPLPDLPVFSGNDLRRTPELTLDRSVFLDEAERSSFDVESSSEWMHKRDRSTSPTPSSATSNSSSPSLSSRGSIQRHSDRKPISSTPPTSDDAPSYHRQNLLSWSEQLSVKLGHAFALHLSTSTNTTEPHVPQHSYDNHDTNHSIPTNEVHVYGFAM
jgi:hypothetical protein